MLMKIYPLLILQNKIGSAKKGLESISTNIKTKRHQKLEREAEEKSLEALKSELFEVNRLVTIERNYLDFIEDGDLIESHIYSINALEKQCSYYLKLIKNKE